LVGLNYYTVVKRMADGYQGDAHFFVLIRVPISRNSPFNPKKSAAQLRGAFGKNFSAIVTGVPQSAS
jgi:hypothetical protein